MTEETVAALAGELKSTAIAAGPAKRFSFNDYTMLFPDGKRQLTTFTEMNVLLLSTSSESALYFSAVTRDRGWRGDVNIIAFLKVDDIAIAQYPLPVAHAFCGATQQQLKVAISGGDFEAMNNLTLQFSAPLWKRCP